MTLFEMIAAIVSLAGIFGWLNYRFLRLPPTIGLMIIALVFSLILVGLGQTGIGWIDPFKTFVREVDFDAALLHGMLGALLFAGALHVNIDDLTEQRSIVAVLATVGILASTAFVGVGSWYLFGWLGVGIPLVWCLLFGSLISPTDPIAVGAILKRVGVPRSLETKIAGESLFNDGVGVVVFLAIAGMATGGHEPTARAVGELLMFEVGGGLLYGGLLGWIVYRMLRSVDNYQVEILLTLALVTGGYALADRLHLSGPLAMVVAGLLIGNRGRRFAMSDNTRERLDAFWELVDEMLNAALFVLIGIDILIIDTSPNLLLAAALAIPLVLLARWVSVGVLVSLLSRIRQFSPHSVKILTWGGLRGGISVALALSLPPGPERGVLVTVTYVIVCFSIIVQGLSIGPLVKRLLATPAS
jgi:CPA1 family monovalent cation:H+ antiporter